MNSGDPTGTDWTEREIDLIVADYFDMLRLELLRQPYVKAHRNRALQDLIGRSKGSIEFKHQNISAVLQVLGEPWIAGYKPRANFQRALVDGVERYLDRPNALVRDAEAEKRVLEVAAESELYIEPPPVVTLDTVTDAGSEAINRLIRKFDAATRDARNRQLGHSGEERILRNEHARLIGAGREDLARKVRWVSEEDGDGAGYDILSFDADTKCERLLEVKTTKGGQKTPFYLTENERLLSTERPNEFRLVRLYDFARTPRVFELAPPLEESVMLRPTTYRASFN